MRYKNTDAIVVKDGGRIEEILDLIKTEIYVDLRQRFEAEEVRELYKKMDDVVKSVFE